MKIKDCKPGDAILLNNNGIYGLLIFIKITTRDSLFPYLMLSLRNTKYGRFGDLDSWRAHVDCSLLGNINLQLLEVLRFKLEKVENEYN